MGSGFSKSCLAVLGLLVLCAGYCLGQEEFSRPKYHLGFTDYAGRMLLWRDVVNVQVGKDLTLPLRIRFAPGQPTARPMFGKFWFCPLLESSLVLESESQLTWMDLGGRTFYLGLRKDGTFASGDGQVVARKTSPSEWILTSDGMEYRYIDAKIKSLKVAPDRVVEWVYQGSRVVGLSNSAEGTLLTIEYGGGQPLPTALVTKENRVTLKTQRVPSVSVVSGVPMVSGFEESLGEFASPKAQYRFPIEFDPSAVRQTDCILCSFRRPRFTFSKISEAVAVQMNGLGSAL